jgi:hypothetical protein
MKIHRLFQLFSFSAFQLFLCAGCVMVPKTRITGSLAGQPFSFSTPQDRAVKGLDITATVTTNGTAIRLHLDSLDSKTNPDVITTTANGQAIMIQSVADAAVKAAATAAK